MLLVLTDGKSWPISMYLHFLIASWGPDQYSYNYTVVTDFNKSFQSAFESVLLHFLAPIILSLVGLSVRLQNQEERKVFKFAVALGLVILFPDYSTQVAPVGFVPRWLL